MHWTSWFHCSNDTSVLPGVTSGLKVLIFRSAQVQTQCQGGNQLPHIWTRWSSTWHLWWWSRGNPSSSWSLGFWRWSGLPQWTPPSPSQKGDLLVILLGVPTPQLVYPCIWRGLLGVHVYFAKCNFLSTIFHELMQVMVSKVSKICNWRQCGIPLLGGVCWGGVCAALPPHLRGLNVVSQDML